MVLRFLALLVKFDNVFGRCFLAPKGDPFFFSFVETEEIAALRLILVLEVELEFEVELELEFSFVCLLLDNELDVELELSRAGRFVERGRALSELKLLSDDVRIFPLEDVTCFGTEGFFACFLELLTDACESFETLVVDADKRDLIDLDGDLLPDLFVIRCVVSVSVGVLLLSMDAFVEDVRHLGDFRVVLDGANGDCFGNTGESIRSLFEAVPGISTRGADLTLFLTEATTTSFACALP